MPVFGGIRVAGSGRLDQPIVDDRRSVKAVGVGRHSGELAIVEFVINLQGRALYCLVTVSVDAWAYIHHRIVSVGAKDDVFPHVPSLLSLSANENGGVRRGVPHQAAPECQQIRFGNWLTCLQVGDGVVEGRLLNSDAAAQLVGERPANGACHQVLPLLAILTPGVAFDMARRLTGSDVDGACFGQAAE